MLIMIRDGSETFDRHHINAVAEADMVIGQDGDVIKASAAGAPTRVNIAEIRRALATQARPRKGANDLPDLLAGASTSGA